MSDPTPALAQTEAHFFRDKLLPRIKLVMSLYLIMLPTIGTILVFSYYPKIDVVFMSFFRWQPPDVMEYIGLKHYKDAFANDIFAESFQLVGILLVANICKMWPGIFAAIALHRMVSNRLRYLFQVLFVVPMIIPHMVWLLIWKSFFEPDFGLFNRFLRLTGLMDVLQDLDTAMPAIYNFLEPNVLTPIVNPVFGGIGGVILLGAMILALNAFREPSVSTRMKSYGTLLLVSIVLPLWQAMALLEGPNSVYYLFGMIVVIIPMLVGLARLMYAKWIIWLFIIIAGIIVFYGELLRLPAMMLVAFAFCEVIRRVLPSFRANDLLRNTGLLIVGAGCLLILFGSIWTQPINQFAEGTPAWLGNKDLIRPSLIIWGFPWISTVGVLILLSGLQQISIDVYEAAELDGVGPIGMMFRIELPLIMTQVRINLIFLTIATLVQYEIFLILLGPTGGAGNAGMVPGLYLFSEAFSQGRFGYACALGMTLFFIILSLTIIYQKYVKVEK